MKTDQTSTAPPRIVTVDRIRDLDPHRPFSLQTTYRLIQNGHLGCRRVGKRILLTVEHLEAFARGDVAKVREAK